MTTPDDPTAHAIVHNETDCQFELRLQDKAVGGDMATASYQRFAIHGDANSHPTGIAYTSVNVPEAYEGKGIGTRLVRHILDYARANGFTVDPVCPFVKAYMKRYPEYKPSDNLPSLD